MLQQWFSPQEDLFQIDGTLHCQVHLMYGFKLLTLPSCTSNMAKQSFVIPAGQDQSGPSLTLLIIVRRSPAVVEKRYDAVTKR